MLFGIATLCHNLSNSYYKKLGASMFTKRDQMSNQTIAKQTMKSQMQIVVFIKPQ
jgi:hypothetical protein